LGSENNVKEGTENGSLGQSKWRRNPPGPSGTTGHHERNVLEERGKIAKDISKKTERDR